MSRASLDLSVEVLLDTQSWLLLVFKQKSNIPVVVHPTSMMNQRSRCSNLFGILRWLALENLVH